MDGGRKERRAGKTENFPFPVVVLLLMLLWTRPRKWKFTEKKFYIQWVCGRNILHAVQLDPLISINLTFKCLWNFSESFPSERRRHTGRKETRVSASRGRNCFLLRCYTHRFPPEKTDRFRDITWNINKCFFSGSSPESVKNIIYWIS